MEIYIYIIIMDLIKLIAVAKLEQEFIWFNSIVYGVIFSK